MERLDLHGVPHYLVRNCVIRKIEDYWNTNTDILFITGNSTAMKEIVYEVLKEYDIMILDNLFNEGCIRVNV